MAVNVAFGPSAGIGGALAFGTGQRKYSDRKDQIEHQSKRQMLSDAMGFAKFLQDARRPEEDQRRSMDRMEKQQEITQENVTFEVGVKQQAAQWDLDFKNKARTQQMDALDAATKKIEEEAQTMRGADVPEQDVARWFQQEVGKSRARILGIAPPQPRNPYEGAITIAGQKWMIDPANPAQITNLSAAKAAADAKRQELGIKTQTMVNDSVSKGTARVLSTFEKRWERLEKASDALEDEYSESKLEDDYESSGKKHKYEAAKRLLDGREEALEARQTKALRRMESGILAPHAVQGGGKDGPASVFSLRLAQLQREEELERAEREEDAFIETGRDAGTMGGAQSLGEALLARDPESPRGLELQQRYGDVRGINPPWGATSEGSENYLPESGGGAARMDLPHSGGTIDGNLYKQIGLDESGELARAAIRQGLLTPADAGTIMADAKSGRKHRKEIRIEGNDVAVRGTKGQLAQMEQIAKDVDRFSKIESNLEKATEMKKGDKEDLLSEDRASLLLLVRKIKLKQRQRFNVAKSRDGVDPAGDNPDAKLNRELEELKADYEIRSQFLRGGGRYSAMQGAHQKYTRDVQKGLAEEYGESDSASAVPVIYPEMTDPSTTTGPQEQQRLRPLSGDVRHEMF